MARTDTFGTTAAGVTSVTNNDGTLIISPNTGLVVASVDQGFNFAWTGQHTFDSFLPTSIIFPTTPNQLVTKLYVDAFMQGLIPYLDCQLATTANIVLSGEQVIDTVLTSASRVLVWKQTNPVENGVYITGAGAWTRATDFDQTAEILQGAFFYITSGSANLGLRLAQYLFTPVSDVINVDPIAFTIISQSAGSISGNGTDNHIMRWDGTNNAQDSDLVISDISGGIVTLGTATAALHIKVAGNGNEFQVEFDPATAGSGAPILMASQDGFGGGQGGMFSTSAGSGGATGIGGPYITSAGQGGITSGRGGHYQIYGGSAGAFAGNADGGDIWLTPGNKTGAGTIGKLRFYAFQGANWSAILDGSLIEPSGADKTFTLPALSGTFALTTNNLSIFAPTTSAQLASIITNETGTGLLVFNTSPTLITPVIGVATGTSLAVTGALTSSGTAGIGYATGAGGSVTQLTNKSTPVTLNKTCGRITMNAANLANNATVSFVLNNNILLATDNLVLNIQGGATVGAYWYGVTAKANGAFTISVRNQSGGPLAQAIVIDFSKVNSVIV